GTKEYSVLSTQYSVLGTPSLPLNSPERGPAPPSLLQPPVLLQNRAQPVVRQCVQRVAVAAGHRSGGDHRAEHRLYRGFDRGAEQRGDAFGGKRLDLRRTFPPADGGRVRGRKGEEDVARSVA